jgi:hypothetical protein
MLKSKFPTIYKKIKSYFPDKNNMIQKKLKLYTIYSDSHKDLFEGYFLSSLKNTDLEIATKKIEQIGSGIYGLDSFNKSMVKKVEVIISAIKDNFGEVFVFSDTDIIFFKKVKKDLLNKLGEKDIVFQSNDFQNSVNTGFFVCRANKKTMNLWKICKENLEKSIDSGLNLQEQDWINIILKENPNLVKFGTLPLDKYYSPREMVNLENIPPIPKTICIYHANYIIGINNKEQLLSKAQQIINEGKGISRIRYYYKYKIFPCYIKFKSQLISYLNPYKINFSILYFVGKIGSVLKSKFPKIYNFLKPYFPDKK